MKNIAAALARFHGLMPDIPKNADNPFFKSKYAPLETILPAIKKPLREAGLVYVQVPSGLNKLKTIILEVGSGESIEGEYEMTPTKNDPQGQGSVLTYMRRYALVSMLGLNTDEDDDGNAASFSPKPSAPAHVQPGAVRNATTARPATARPATNSAPSQPWAVPRINPPTINHQQNV